MLSSAFNVQRPIAVALALAAAPTAIADVPARPAAVPSAATVSPAGEDTTFRSGFHWSAARRAMIDLLRPDALVAPPAVNIPNVGDPIGLMAWRLIRGWMVGSPQR